MATEIRTATAYEALGVDPCAPIDLISASYWNLVKELQKFRERDARVETLLHHAMRAYETLADPNERKAYDASIDMKQEPLTKRKFHRAKTSRLGFLPGRKKLQISADPYEVMGLHPTTLQSSIPDAYRAMKQQYLRLPPGSRRRVELLRVLDESYAVLNDPEKRALYDEGAAKVEEVSGVSGEVSGVSGEVSGISDEVPGVSDEVPGVRDQVPGVSDEAEVAPVEEVVVDEVSGVRDQVSGMSDGMVVEEEVAPPPTPAITVPDSGPSQAGRLRRTAAKVEMDDLVPPVPVYSPARPRKAKVEGDVEAVMLGRLAARMNELAAFGGSGQKSEE